MHRQEPVFSNFILMVTEECNLRCDYCYMVSNPQRIGEDVIAKSLDFMFGQTCENNETLPLSLCFFGGEPLMVPEVIEDICFRVLERAKVENREIRFSMTSNGTLIDQTRAELIKLFRIKVNLSIDGAGEAQDRHRKQTDGRGSFRLIENNIDLIRSLPYVSVRLTVSPDTAPLLSHSVHWLLDNGFESIFFSPVVEANWSAYSLSALYDAYKDLHAFQKQNSRKKAKIKNLARDFDRLRKGHSRHYGCGASRNLVAIDASGNLYPCQRFFGYFGKSQESRIGTVFDGIDPPSRAKYMSYSRLENSETCGSGIYAEGTESRLQHCGNCLLFPVCHAGCMAVNAVTTGSPVKASPVNRLLAQVAASACLTVFGDLQDYENTGRILASEN
ncbi:MAG: SPASM domain-containing protein [Chlorobi bacterium]|nr:SPASM domain-containing protein [Chlorobiota bacterium]